MRRFRNDEPRKNGEVKPRADGPVDLRSVPRGHLSLRFVGRRADQHRFSIISFFSSRNYRFYPLKITHFGKYPWEKRSQTSETCASCTPSPRTPRRTPRPRPSARSRGSPGRHRPRPRRQRRERRPREMAAGITNLCSPRSVHVNLQRATIKNFHTKEGSMKTK